MSISLAPQQRRVAAHLRASVTHEQSAVFHEVAASVSDGHGRAELAATERQPAEMKPGSVP